MTYRQARLKLSLEAILVFPFMLLGKLYGRLSLCKYDAQIFMFFPNADIGGAPRVNADIAACLKDKKLLLIFSKKAKNNRFINLYKNLDVPILDLHQRIDNKAYHFVNFFYRGVLAAWINKAQDPVVFGGESLFFYKVIPHIRKNIPCIELSHLPTWLSYNIGFIDRINQRVFSSEHLKKEVEKQYREINLPEKYFHRLQFIDNAIDIPEYKPADNKVLEIVFIGRGSPQKRVHLIAEAARILYEQKAPVQFTFVGDVENCLDIHAFPFCKFLGNINDEKQMQEIYTHSDVLLLTSAYEGLPLVVMTMMAYGKTIISTAVNAIPDYIFHQENGLLITETDEQKIVAQAVFYIQMLEQNRACLKQCGDKSRMIAIEKFGREKFCHTYRNLLIPQ